VCGSRGPVHLPSAGFSYCQDKGSGQEADEEVKYRDVGYRLGKIAAVVAVLAVLYVLSAGPAVWLHIRTGYGKPVLEAAYEPLRPLMGNDDLFERYLAWWVHLALSSDKSDQLEPASEKAPASRQPASDQNSP